jgi:hypothetical protein
MLKKHIDKYRKHCLRTGTDMDAKKPQQAVWTLVSKSEKKAWLGVIKMATHSGALIRENLHKFFLIKQTYHGFT